MQARTRILIADDNAKLVGMYLESSLVREPGLEIDVAPEPRLCIAKVMRCPYDIVLLDISFSEGGQEGLEMIRDIRALCPDSDIIVVSSITDKSVMLKAMEFGATDYVVKASDSKFDDMILRIKAAMAQRRYKRAAAAEGELLAATVGAVFSSRQMRDVFAATSVARKAGDCHVLITGPTGSGKEVVARAIARPDTKRPFVLVNCAAIAPSVLESELFGHVRGAFTGALSDRPGLFEAAHGGDIFLDEVACLSEKAQAALLRVIQSGEFNRVGSPVTKRVVVRVIAATNRNLDDAVKKGEFREDLLARLQVISIAIPPLCERREDIIPIVRQTLEQSGKEHVELTEDCRAFLEAYAWPKNVRQLKATVLSMAAFATSNVLSIGDIPREILSTIAPDRVQETGGSGPDLSFQFRSNMTFDEATRHFQAYFIETKIAAMNGVVNPASLAAILDMPRSTLNRKLKDLGIGLKRFVRVANQSIVGLRGGQS